MRTTPEKTLAALRSATLCLSLILVFGTPSASSTESSEPSTPLLPSTAQRVVNGIYTADYPTTVALLSNNGRSFCSGTLIGCNTVLTASHCVCQSTGANCGPGGQDLSNPANIRVFAQSGGIFGVSSIDVPSNYVFGSTSDVALLHLADSVNGVPPTPINTSGRLPPGTTARLVGFGLSRGDRNDTGLKRYGDVTTSTCQNVPDGTHVCWTFDNPIGNQGEDSNTCPGDSGGPLFWNNNGTWTVAGVTSGGASQSCLPPDLSYDADVFFDRSWIQTKGGADISNTTCGALAQVGSPAVNVLSSVGTLDAQNEDRLFNFQVPAGTEHLRVSLNGDDGTENDFDLYVRAGTPPTTGEYDCRPFKEGNPEVCDFSSPATGIWYIGVVRFAGEGTFQTTATLFGEAQAIFSDGFESGNTSAWTSKAP